MQDLFSRLIAALNARGPDDDEVNTLIAQIETEGGPAAAAEARAVRSAWRRSHGKAPDPQHAAGPGLLSWKGITALLATLGIGGGITTGVRQVDGNTVDQVVNRATEWSGAQFTVPSNAAQLGIIALVGAASGLAFAAVRDRGLDRPRFTTDAHNNRFVLSKLGFLNDLAAGALVAVGTSWAAAPAAPPAADPALPAPPGAPIRVGALVGAAFAGMVGSRMRNQALEKWLLQKALAVTAQLPALPKEWAQAIRKADPTDAVTLATGVPVAGHPTPKPPDGQADPVAAARELVGLLDPEAARPQVVAAGRVGPDAAGLTVAALRPVRFLIPELRDAIGRVPVAVAADKSTPEFVQLVSAGGFNAAPFADALDKVRAAAVQVRDRLRALPPGRELTPDHFPAGPAGPAAPPP